MDYGYPHAKRSSKKICFLPNSDVTTPWLVATKYGKIGYLPKSDCRILHPDLGKKTFFFCLTPKWQVWFCLSPLAGSCTLTSAKPYHATRISSKKIFFLPKSGCRILQPDFVKINAIGIPISFLNFPRYISPHYIREILVVEFYRNDLWVGFGPHASLHWVRLQQAKSTNRFVTGLWSVMSNVLFLHVYRSLHPLALKQCFTVKLVERFVGFTRVLFSHS